MRSIADRSARSVLLLLLRSISNRLHFVSRRGHTDCCSQTALRRRCRRAERVARHPAAPVLLATQTDSGPANPAAIRPTNPPPPCCSASAPTHGANPPPERAPLGPSPQSRSVSPAKATGVLPRSA